MARYRTYAAIAVAALFLVLTPACAGDDGWEEVEEDADVDLGKADAGSGPLTIVEIGDDFVELRNDGRESVDLNGWYLSFSRRRVRLLERKTEVSAVPPGGLALVVDADRGIPDRAPAWIPAVDTSRDLEELLAHSKSLILRTPERAVSDRIDARDTAVRGVAVERRLRTRVALSALGATPGSRNVIHDDGAFAVTFANPLAQAENPLPARAVALIDAARDTIDAAIYQIDHPDVIAAFVRAAERGVTVRLATDSTYLDDEDYAGGYRAMMDAGVAVVGDGRGARQHNKFIVIDSERVWVGSFNPLQTPTYINHDNMVAIESEELAAIFTAELDEMFSGRFGPKKTDDGHHVAYVDGSKVEVYFSPTDHPLHVILREIGRARSNIYFSSFAFYLDEVGDAMRARHASGVDVRGTLDRRSATSASEYASLLDDGIDVRRPYYDGLLHHKFIIVDYGTADPVVITGSYNLSGKAETANDESVVVIHDPYVVKTYYEAWSRLYDSCSGPNTDTTGLAPVTLSEVYAGYVGAAGPYSIDRPFVELANLSSDELSLDSLVLRDRDGNEMPLSGTIAPGSRTAIDVSALGIELSDSLVVMDADRRIVARFDEPGYYGPGRSIERDSLSASDNDATWAPSAEIGGTPGR